MTTISISQLKINPMAVMLSAQDFPVKVKNRDKTAGYFLGKDLFEKMIEYLEDIEDSKVIERTDFSKGTSFEDVAKELGI
ncbi:MAG: antitoxin [Patescibacteria group bacterium]